MKKLLVLAGVAVFSTSLFAADGAALYNGKCAGCHGADGSKVIAAMNVKPLNTTQAKSLGVGGMSSVVANGKGKMPAFAGKLTPDQINSVCTYVISLK